MADFKDKDSRVEDASGASRATAPAPGKRSLVQRRYAGVAPRSAPTAAPTAGGGAAPLPDDVRGKMEGSFGVDLSAVRVHEGAEAPAVGAVAFAQGTDLHFAPGAYDPHSTPGQELLGHELAHVVQQASGRVAATSQHKGAAIADDPALEREADIQGARAARGEPADGGLGLATIQPLGAGGPSVQRKLTVKSAVEEDPDVVWGRIKDDERLAGKDQAKDILVQWILRKDKYKEQDQVSENRMFASDDELISALVGEVDSAKNLELEGALSTETLNDERIGGLLAMVLGRLKDFHSENAEALAGAKEKSGRYAGWAYEKGTLTEVLANAPGDISGRIAFIADYALMMRGDIKDKVKPKQEQAPWDFRVGAELDEARPIERGANNANEGAEWTQRARAKTLPLSQGPSATTAQVLALAIRIGAPMEEMEALAWGLFALWNGMPRHQSGTHRFHEVMVVAAQYGVPYKDLEYPEGPPQKKSML